MLGDKKIPATVDEYIAQFPEDVQSIMQQIRAVIHEAAPDVVEKISYQMPAFHYKGVLVWFGGHTNHIGFYPTGEGIEAFKGELSGYKYSKGAIQFPLGKPMPFDLIRRIVKYRLESTLKK